MLSKINDKNLLKEKEILKNLFKNISKNKSTLFNAGAGAGKTYSLIECLKYVIREEGRNLENKNKKVICITYTNVATNEIKERLGNTNLILVSTIHERIWSLINNKLYQSKLVEIHFEYTKEKIKEENEKLKKNKKYLLYNKEEKSYINEIISKTNIKIQFLNKDNFEEELKKENISDEIFFDMKVTNFKEIYKKLKKISKLENCLKEIENKKYKNIEYTPLFNFDVLHKMKISHDTLLEYGYRMIKKFDLLKQIIIDKYPYIFIDEYQDTDEKVVKIMNLLDEYSKKINHKFYVGYFGDYVQNIYNSGVGESIKELHTDLDNVYKKYNRRSAKEIIEVANKIKKNEFPQESIYEDSDGGTIEFFSGKEEEIKAFLEKVEKEWNITQDSPLHCFILTNKLIAEYSGFQDIYDFFYKSDYYKKNYNQLTSELFSNDMTKLGSIPSFFFRISKFLNDLQNEKTFVTDIFSKVYRGKNLKQLRTLKKIMVEIRNSKKETLNDYLEKIFELYNRNEDLDYKKIVKNVFQIEDISLENIKKYIIQELFDDEYGNNINEVENFLKIEINQYFNWYRYLIEEKGEKIYYHTYHGTKGREFENVVIIMENSFGRNNKNLFFDFFKNYNKKIEEKDLKKHNEARNLLYVSVTRAIKNLKIFYIDDISEFSGNIKKVFGDIKKFQ
ncbi:ATP-dependent DNA helicase Rep [Leptotrichia shahii]|uniref:ATP-dependent DNA helicase Rep n=1 Tax=Leptotrichia shahii TaxID=157691 RepID=A0A510JKJ8_9FUSO|nr:UvrD-helicase domain-containing protein [Leptotrichia shahii]BBM39838.1 ATP-dependent DNA helicase Rep [Leptotrichia shahii]